MDLRRTIEGADLQRKVEIRARAGMRNKSPLIREQ